VGDHTDSSLDNRHWSASEAVHVTAFWRHYPNQQQVPQLWVRDSFGRPRFPGHSSVTPAATPALRPVPGHYLESRTPAVPGSEEWPSFRRPVRRKSLSPRGPAAGSGRWAGQRRVRGEPHPGPEPQRDAGLAQLPSPRSWTSKPKVTSANSASPQKVLSRVSPVRGSPLPPLLTKLPPNNCACAASAFRAGSRNPCLRRSACVLRDLTFWPKRTLSYRFHPATDQAHLQLRPGLGIDLSKTPVCWLFPPYILPMGVVLFQAMASPLSLWFQKSGQWLSPGRTGALSSVCTLPIFLLHGPLPWALKYLAKFKHTPCQR
jgi:hypothetical protein